MTPVYCTECGFQNAETARYCARCGALIAVDPLVETTLTFSVEELRDAAAGHDADAIEGPALVVRSGGGRAGESFALVSARTRIGRSPDCEVFLDDVTVSRNHAVVVNNGGACSVEDQSSLNGTFVNRRRIDAVPLTTGDELQIGKYRLTFIAQ